MSSWGANCECSSKLILNFISTLFIYAFYPSSQVVFIYLAIGLELITKCVQCVETQFWVAKKYLNIMCIFINPTHFDVSNSICNVWLQDDPCFILHFDEVRTVTAISSSAKYAIVRALVALSEKYCQSSLNLQNFDWAYIKPTSFYSNRGDCVVLSQICFYAFNLVCLSMCPVPLDA